MDAINAMIACIPCTGELLDQQWSVGSTDGDIANKFVEALLTAEKPGQDLDGRLDGVVGVTGCNWGENLAKTILAKLERAIVIGAQMSSAMREAVDRSIAAAEGFAKEHPVYTTLIAIGVMIVLSPCVIEALGFGELGPIEGSFAAAWQRAHAGYLPRGALFGYFQRLGMIWRRYAKAQ